MALSNSQYDAIMREYGRQQMENRHRQEKRREEVCKKVPAVLELEAEIASHSVACAKGLLAGNEKEVERLREELADLREQKSVLIRSAGFPEDYMELQYRCPDCHDTGYVNGKKCHCFLQAQMKLLYAQSNLEEVLDQENFSVLTFDYYDDQQVIPQIGMTNARYMKQVVGWCRSFVENFSQRTENLLFTGSTGVGKTFLTNCIAKELMNRYFSVIYLSAPDLFDVFSRIQFSYQQEEDMRDMYRYILDCDLLIIDDLGTELNNSFTSSRLFYCLNERMNMKRSTIISTNLSVAMLRDSYTDRVTSRIMSGYTVIPLYGGDIELLDERPLGML